MAKVIIENKHYEINIHKGAIWSDDKIEIEEFYIYDEKKEKDFVTSDVDYWLQLISSKDLDKIYDEFIEQEFDELDYKQQREIRLRQVEELYG